MKAFLKGIPWFYVLISVFPLLFLWRINVFEISASVVLRPFLVTLLGSAVLYGILYIIFRNVGRAALMGSLILAAFFSYGQVYHEARTLPVLKILSHHSTLIPIYLVIFGLGIWGILRTKKYERVNQYLNIVSLILVVIQVAQLSYSFIGAFYGAHRPVILQSGLTVTAAKKDLPDIYLIVLDSYTREDAMKQDLGFNDAPFIDQLQKLGFYVARCSRPNYRFTLGSIAAVLNMKYIPGAYAEDFYGSSYWSIIKNNEVRSQLESIGYKTVSFLGDDPRVSFEDADILYSINRPAINFRYLYSFEAMYVKSTAAIVITDLNSKLKIFPSFSQSSTNQETSSVDYSGMSPINHDLIRDHVTAQLFFLDKLPEVPAIEGQKFTYIHISIPHFPYVFSSDGKMLTDPGFYGGDRGNALDPEHEKQGYLDQVQYINMRIIPILQTILRESKTPPIIVLMGDHGLRDNNRFANLNAYYLPKGYKDLYPSITPVNSFRIILNEYFGANYPLLPDVTYEADTLTVNETYSDCMP
jgi:hypothetical protein